MSDALLPKVRISRAVRKLGLSDGTVCVHASLRSFGRVDGGANTVVDAFLEQRCTVLVPTFSWDAFAVSPPETAAMRPRRNGYDYSRGYRPATSRVYDAESDIIDGDMGAIPRAVVERTGRSRGDHPIASFAAVGPAASTLVERQTPTDPFAPLRALIECRGNVALMGVGLTSMTLLHLAEQVVGRTPLYRWALRSDGEPMLVAVGGCSDGFESLNNALAPLQRQATVGQSRWRVFLAESALSAAAQVIAADPSVVHCGRECARCDDALAGGPVFAG